MKIDLPWNKHNNIDNPSAETKYIIDKNIVIIGANGTGKTRLGVFFEQKNLGTTHRISAQKSLVFPQSVTIDSLPKLENEFCFGWDYHDRNGMVGSKMVSRWSGRPETALLNDYEKLVKLLLSQDSDISIEFRRNHVSNKPPSIIPVTHLDIIAQIWERLIPHRKLCIGTGRIDVAVVSQGGACQNYNASELSDGERVIFYLIGSALCAMKNALIIIDEPELHLHKSISNKLWNEIENARPDCTFIYITHDIDFAFSRTGAVKIWTREFDGKNWTYDILNEETPIAEALYFEILGSRTPVLFIEGDSNSIDNKLLPHIFPGLTVKPLGGCEKVFTATVSFNAQKEFHQVLSYGLIDRDRMTEDDIACINFLNFWSEVRFLSRVPL